MQVATATHSDVVATMRAPYHVTLWTYCHLQQRARLDDIREQARQLHAAGLMTYAFHEPKRLADEHQRLLTAVGATSECESADDARARALALVADIERADARGAWQ